MTCDIIEKTISDKMNITKTNEPKKGHTYLQWLTAILVNGFTVIYGLQIGWLSAVTSQLQSPQSPAGRALSTAEVAWVASVPPLVSAFISPPYSALVDRYGRRVGIMTIGLAQAMCWLLSLIPDPNCLIVSRVFTGVAAGGCYNIIPMYVKEISQTHMRGILGFIIVLCQNLGVLIMYGMGAYMDYHLVLYIMVGIPIANAVLMFKASESPVYLVKIGKSDEAAKTMAYLWGLDVDDKVVQNEMDNIKREDEVFKSIPNINFFSIFKNKVWRKAFIIMAVLMATRGCNGSMAIIMYASTILRQSGVTFNPELQSISLPIFMIIGSFVAMACVERLGRKPILVCTSVLTAASFLGLAAVSAAQAAHAVPAWAPVLLLVTAQFAFAAGVSPIPFIILSECFNFQIRAKMMGILTGFSWLWIFVQCLAFGPVTTHYGVHVSFLVFTVINVIGIVTILVFPETKGRTIEQIEEELAGNKGKTVCAS